MCEAVAEVVKAYDHREIREAQCVTGESRDGSNY
jgi:hypothetical protein